MTSFRFATIIFIIGAGLVVSYFIIYDSPSDGVETVSRNEARQTNETISPADKKSETPLQWIENFDSLTKNKPDVLTPQNNLTLSIGQELIEGIKSAPEILDFEKGSLSAGAGLLSKKLIDKAFSTDQLGLAFVINKADIKTSSDNSSEAKARYLKAIEEIGRENFANFDKNYFRVIYETYGENNPASAVQLAEIYKNLANKALSLAPPTDYLELHKRIILSYKNAEIVYRAMANYSSDPIKGYLALEMVRSLIDGIEQVQKTVYERAQEVKLY